MNKNFYFEELQSFNLFCDGPIKMANCEKKRGWGGVGDFGKQHPFN